MKKRNLHKILLVSLTAVSVVLLVVSWIMPPPWEIHDSVIKGVAELFGFAALTQVVPAIESGRSVKIHKGDTDIEIEGREV